MKKIYILILTILLCFCTGCENKEVIGKSFQELKSEIDTELEAARNGKYENLNITFDKVRLPENETIQSVSFPVYEFTKKMTLEEKLVFYKDTIFPKLYDVETIEKENIVATNYWHFDESNVAIYEYDYDAMLNNTDKELEADFHIGYINEAEYQYMDTIPEGVCMNISRGVMGTFGESRSPFVEGKFEEIKSYNCYLDDLSDSYLLMDGEKTVAEAKAEIEAYLNSHYPLVGEDNGIKHEVIEITVRKITGTEYHAFCAHFTFRYNGMCVKASSNVDSDPEVSVMAQAALCKSNHVDTQAGFVNCFEQGTVIKTYEEFISFTEVMERLAYYLTGDTTFNIGYIGMEYRMFTEVVDDVTYYNWVPYWSFLAENPNDDKTIRIYMNIETGEMESYEI